MARSLTAGQLRAALAQMPDDLPVGAVWEAEEGTYSFVGVTVEGIEVDQDERGERRSVVLALHKEFVPSHLLPPEEDPR